MNEIQVSNTVFSHLKLANDGKRYYILLRYFINEKLKFMMKNQEAFLHVLQSLNRPYHKEKVMGSLAFSVIQGASLSVRRQQLAPQFSIGVFERGQVDRQAKRVPEAFEGTFKVVICCRRCNSSRIQVMELVH